MQSHKLKKDFLISVCITGDEVTLKNLENLISNISYELEQIFFFSEVIILNCQKKDDKKIFSKIIKTYKNVRIINVNSGLSYYKQRVIAVSEALGDFVVIYSPHEIDVTELKNIINKSISSGNIIIATQRTGFNIIDWILKPLSKVTSFRIDSKILRTVVLPRTKLNLVLSNPDKVVAMRYIPIHSSFPVQEYITEKFSHEKNYYKGIYSRLEIIRQLFIISSPKILNFIAIISVIGIIISFLFIIYAILVLFSFTDVEPGWFTTTILIATTSSLLNLTLLGISLSLQRIIDLTSQNLDSEVIEEKTANEIFANLSNELNISEIKKSSDSSNN